MPIDLPSLEHQISLSNFPLGPKRLGGYSNKTMLEVFKEISNVARECKMAWPWVVIPFCLPSQH